MNIRLIKGYVLSAVTLLVLGAAVFILLNNIRQPWTATIFFGPVEASATVWMLVCAAAGLILWLTAVKLAPAALSALRQGKKVSRERATAERIKNLEKHGSQPPAGEK